jgi:hypothetical protein
MANSLSPIGISAVKVLARLAAKRAVQDNLRAQGVRVSLFPIAEIMRQAGEYLAAHPELYQQALERAHKLGYIDPLSANLKTNAQPNPTCSDKQISVQISGVK